MFSEVLPNLAIDDHRLHPADPRQRDPARGGAVLPRRRRPAAESVVGDDDLRRHHDDPGRVPQRAGAGDHARAHGAVDQRFRRRPARRAGSAGEGPDRPRADGPLRRPPADRDGRGAVRDLGAHVPDVRGDSQRRPRAAPRRTPGDRRRDPPDSRQVRLRQADLRPVRAHDEEHLHGPGLLLHAGLQRARRDQGRPSGDGVAGARGGHLLAVGLDRRGHARGRSKRGSTPTGC